MFVIYSNASWVVNVNNTFDIWPCRMNCGMQDETWYVDPEDG